MENQNTNEKVPKTSKLAIVAFSFALLSILPCLIWILEISNNTDISWLAISFLPAIIVGAIAKLHINEHKNKLKGSAIALISIVVGSLSLPANIILPEYMATARTARQVVCKSQLKHLAFEMIFYAYKYEGKYPTPEKWSDILSYEAVIDEAKFQCPAAKEGSCNYAVNKNIYTTDKELPVDLVLVFESKPGWNQVGGPELMVTDYHKHLNGCHIAFADGTVKFIKTEDLGKLRWTIDQE